MIADLKRLQTDPVVSTKSRRSLWIPVAIVALIFGFLGLRQFSGGQFFSSGPKRIAVLPFENSGEKDKDYFASGMTDEIINKLISIEDLKVITKQSAAKMKQEGMDVSQIGKKLDVDYVLDASVHWLESSSGAKRVKLMTRLVNVSDGSVLWGKSYDTTMTELFDIQSDMAERIAGQLGVVLSAQEKVTVAGRTTDSEEAWNFYIQGEYYFAQDPYSKKFLNLAMEMYSKAIEMDSTFVGAYLKKTLMYSRLYFYYLDTSDSMKTLAKEMADKALEFSYDHTSENEAHLAIANYYYRCERDFVKALKSLEKAYEHFGGNDNTWFHYYAHLYVRRMGVWDEGYEHIKLVAELEPRNFHVQVNMAEHCRIMRKYEEAELFFRKAIKLRPDYFDSYYELANVYLNWQGDTKRAWEVVESSWNKIEDSTRWNSTVRNLYGMERDFDALRKQADSYSDKALLYEWQDLDDSASVYWDSALIESKEELENKTTIPEQWGNTAKLYARAGNHKEALSHVNKAIELMPMSKDAIDGTFYLIQLFYCYVFLGEFENATDQAEIILKVPAYFDIGHLLLHPDTQEFIKHPGFARLVGEYGNEFHRQLFEEKVGALEL